MENQIANCVIVAIGVGIYLFFKSRSKEVQEKEAQKKDVNITFKNGISLEKKQYPEMKDDFRESIDYKLEPKRRIK